MSGSNALSYSAALGLGHASNTKAHSISHNTTEQPRSSPRQGQKPQPEGRKRTPSPSHIPRTGSGDGEEDVYVLTLLTDKPHHLRMTDLRKKYFPKKINKLAAHLTLFHALPRSKIESSIVPTIQDVISHTSPFKIHATSPFHLKKGFAISIASQNGGRQAKAVHAELQDVWKKEGWLSEQDAGGCRVHYTLMNKVDHELEVQEAFEELKREWKDDWGIAEGLALWRYDRGWWRWERGFNFEGKGHESG